MTHRITRQFLDRVVEAVAVAADDIGFADLCDIGRFLRDDRFDIVYVVRRLVNDGRVFGCTFTPAIISKYRKGGES